MRTCTPDRMGYRRSRCGTAGRRPPETPRVAPYRIPRPDTTTSCCKVSRLTQASHYWPRMPLTRQSPMSFDRSDVGWIQTLSHRLGLVLSITILATAGGWTLLSRLVSPQYVARARISVAASARLGPQNGEARPDTSTAMNLFLSPAILEEVVTDLGLCVEPNSTADAVVLSGLKIKKGVRPGAYRLVSDVVARRFTLFDQMDSAAQAGSWGDSVGSALGFEW